MEEIKKTSKAKRTLDVKRLVQLGMLIAIMIVLEFTGLGIIPIGFGFEITIFVIPVVIGAMVVGKTGGAILGGVFGLLSFSECFGKSAFGTLLFGLNPAACVLICFVPRILIGLIAGITFDALKKRDKTKVVSYAVSALIGSLVNTVLFVGGVVAVFWNNAEFIETLTAWGIPTNTVWALIWGIVGVNGIVEAVFNTIVGAAIAKTLNLTVNRKSVA